MHTAMYFNVLGQALVNYASIFFFLRIIVLKRVLRTLSKFCRQGILSVMTDTEF